MRDNDLLAALEAAAEDDDRTPETPPMTAAEAALGQIKKEATTERPIPLPWPRLSRMSKFLKAGSLSVVGGSPGCGKSFFALALGLACREAGAPWAYMPLESDKPFYLRRAACMLDESWNALADPEDDPDAERIAAEAIDRVKHRLEGVADCIAENPALPTPTRDARTITPDYILQWTEDRLTCGCRAVILDPLCMIHFSGRNQWEAENRFILDMVNLAYRKRGCIVIVAHLVKKVENRMLETGDLQGGASLGRNASSVLLLQKHGERESPVFRRDGMTATVKHNRTMTIAKSRNQEASFPMAFTFGKKGATFFEHGCIAPKGMTTQPTPTEERTPYQD